MIFENPKIFLFVTKVPKGLMRKFITTCIDLINEQDKQIRTSLIKAAGAKGIFHPDLSTNDFQLMALDQNVVLFRKEVLALIEIVEKAEDRITIKDVDGWWTLTYDRDGNYLESDDGGKRTIFYSNEPPVKIACKGSQLFSTFLSVLSEFAASHKKAVFQVPIKVCKECGDVFLGRSLSQQFCSKLHGNRWRGREAYRIKKAKLENEKKVILD